MLTYLPHSDALNTRMGALEQHREQVRREGWIRESGRLAKAQNALVLSNPVFLNDSSRRMIRVGKLGESVSKSGPSLFHGAKLRGGAAGPVLEQALWISGVHGGQILPLIFFVRDYAPHPFRDQVILRVEVAVERHLVRLRRFGDRFDADAPNALLMKQVPRRHENPLANGNRGAALFSRLTVAVNICLHDTFYPSLTRMLPLGNIRAGAECYRSVTYYMSIRSATRIRSTGHQPGSRAT